MSTESAPQIDATTAEEIERRRRTADMMLSMHSALRDRYARWAAVLDLLIFGGSTVVTATVLLDPRVLSYLRVSDDGARILLGAVSTLVFFLSILALRVDWKEKAGRHQRGGTVLGELKARGRLLGSNPDAAAIAEYLRLYDFVMAGIEPIPERHFLPLKAQHRHKLVLSKAIDRFPSTPLLLLRLRLLWADSKVAWTSARKEDG